MAASEDAAAADCTALMGPVIQPGHPEKKRKEIGKEEKRKKRREDRLSEGISLPPSYLKAALTPFSRITYSPLPLRAPPPLESPLSPSESSEAIMKLARVCDREGERGEEGPIS